MTTVRMIGVAWALLMTAACALRPARTASDALEPVRVALAWIEQERADKLTVIVGQNVQQKLAALSRERKVVAQDAMAPGIPAGYFLLTSLEVSGASARVTGWLGPTLPSPPGLFGGCGTGYEIPLRRSGVTWVVVDGITITDC